MINKIDKPTARLTKKRKKKTKGLRLRMEAKTGDYWPYRNSKSYEGSYGKILMPVNQKTTHWKKIFLKKILVTKKNKTQDMENFKETTVLTCFLCYDKQYDQKQPGEERISVIFK